MIPDGFRTRMQRLLGQEYDAFAQSYARPLCTALRFNPLKAEPAPALDFVGERVPWAQNGYYCDPAARPGLHPYHAAGVYYLQEPSAMAPAELLDAQPGELVLDLCAAPGGKSTQIAAQMRGKGLLLCNEIHPTRAKILSQNVERMGIANALVLNETPQRLAQRFAHCFDRVLVDAPCSGEGMFRKETDAARDWSEQTVRRCAARQLDILTETAGLLKPGGRLVYSTCTFSPEENEGVIAAFLARFGDFALLDARLPGASPGRGDWIAGGTAALARTCRLWPHRVRGEGHFAAVLQYQGGGAGAFVPIRRQTWPEEWTCFAEQALTQTPDGLPLAFGQTLCAVPEQTPRLDGLRVLRAGLELGQLRKGRLLPAHALALHLHEAAQTVRLDAGSPQLQRYLQGGTLPSACRGWTLIFAGDYSVGWAKGADGTLKNHYPKGLRLPDNGAASAAGFA